MNFPGLDPAWTWFHRAGHALRVIKTFSLEEARAAVAQGGKILVVATTALGDSLLTLPLVQTLAERLGPERISLLVRAPYAELYQGDPRVHHVFTVRGKFRWSGLADKLADDPHDLALLANMTEPDLVPQLWHCGVRGFLRYRSRWTRYPAWMANTAHLRRPGAEGYATGHAIENNLAMGSALGIEPTSHLLDLPHLRADPSARENLLLLHPGASRENKRWPVQSWARLADALVERFDCSLALTGDRSEHSLAALIVASMRMRERAQVLAGKLPLVELARLQARALAFLSGDTGPYHLAVAVGCPTVTLFAPTDRGSSIEACGPHQADPDRHRAIQTASFGDPISTLSFERVWEEVSRLLETSTPLPARREESA